MNKRLPSKCPSCGSGLNVKTLQCSSCLTTIDGQFVLPALAQLDEDSQRFILSFVKHSGSLKEMAREMGLSYPTVRNLLDSIIEQLNKETLSDKQ